MSFRLAIASSLLSIVIGLSWLFLLLTGNLEDSIFGGHDHDHDHEDEAHGDQGW